MKSYTDIEQSKRLEEILPIESADMFLALNGTLPVMSKYIDNGLVTADDTAIPCWSLSALLGVLPIVYTNNKKEICGPLHIDITDSETPFVLWYVNPLHKGSIVELQTKEYDNLVDACVEMIIELHEQKLL